MKILQLGKFYPIRGGVEKVMWDIARGLVARDVRCDMLCAILPSDIDLFNNPKKGQVISFGKKGRCYCVPALRKVAATMISPAMVRWLRKHRKDYDIIHIHHPDPMACFALFLSGYKGRVILHWHSDILKQKGLLRLYEPFQRWLIRRAEVIAGTTPVYVAQSPWLKDVQDKVTYIPIGVEGAENVQAPGLQSDTVTVFSLGRLVEYKGFEYLVGAAEYLPDNYRIVIGGAGPLRQDLQDKISEAGLEKKVRLLGYLTDDEVKEWFHKCDLFAMSSIMKTEAFGIVQIEAMSCGKPVIATHIPGSGVDWVNADGISGINVAPRDSEAIADAILQLTSDRSEYLQFCENARRRYEELFTLDTMIDNCLRLYEAE